MVGSARCWWHSSNSAFHKRLCFWYGTRYENLASCYAINNDYDGIFNGSLVEECRCVCVCARECASVRCILLPSGLLLFCVFSNFVYFVCLLFLIYLLSLRVKSVGLYVSSKFSFNSLHTACVTRRSQAM